MMYIGFIKQDIIVLKFLDALSLKQRKQRKQRMDFFMKIVLFHKKKHIYKKKT